MMEEIVDKKLKLSSNARIRKEGDRYLIVNLATQGLHFISPKAYPLVAALDGAKTVRQVVEAVFGADSGAKLGSASNFLSELIKRRVLTIV